MKPNSSFAKLIFFFLFQSENFGLTSPVSSFPTAQSTPCAKRSSSLTTPNNSLQDTGNTSPIRSHKLSDAPRTPTPFKRALADVYQRCEPLSNTVSFSVKVEIFREINFLTLFSSLKLQLKLWKI